MCEQKRNGNLNGETIMLKRSLVFGCCVGVDCIPVDILLFNICQVAGSSELRQMTYTLSSN